ncbi:MAG: hypothetical protein J6R26_01685 [Paludibacteraceae bacterium]|jgi:hypothetical protein|nr:hypothetical protein [Paludibacteraceae bacterium]
MKRIILLGSLCWLGIALFAEVPIERPNLRESTGIAPLYFGPNAFPVPDILDGRVQNHLRVEVAGDGYFGFQGDKTADVFARVFVPLFSDRVNLTIWMPIMEWYQMTQERMAICRISDSLSMRGSGAGDAYFSTDIQLVRDKKWVPDIALRAACKSASGGQFEMARHYDCPGYFIDLSLGKSWFLNSNGNSMIADKGGVELRVAGSAGFLCWQTDNGRQNDAMLYGLQLLLNSRYVSFRTTWSGYVGWENDGDQPMIIKGRLSGRALNFEPYVEYQYGINDYPFHMLRVGLAYNIDILSSLRK